MSSGLDALTDSFVALQPHLVGAAYRIVGTVGDAEDAVQEAWLRLSRLTPGERAAIEDLRAWLITVVGRLCLDRLRSAAARRERYVGTWLPEPVVRPLGPTPVKDPLDAAVRDEDLRLAALVVLQRLTPEQRVAFVLHDAFAVPFPEIAETLGCSAAAARQHASRARRAVADAEPPPRAELAEQQRVLDAFLSAFVHGDVAKIVRMLHPDAVVIGDGGGKARTARRAVFGAEKVARFLVGLSRKYYGRSELVTARVVLVNGDLGLLVPAVVDERGGLAAAHRVVTFAVRDGRLAAVYDVVNPDKLTRVAW
ncbi:sigma-70 family RNA polymerase sigma factor [Longimycelium tulufanense]|nr:sigma-70 family RNA polymerase sigma factor [Longimycelium tulufanense]